MLPGMLPPQMRAGIADIRWSGHMYLKASRKPGTTAAQCAAHFRKRGREVEFQDVCVDMGWYVLNLDQ